MGPSPSFRLLFLMLFGRVAALPVTDSMERTGGSPAPAVPCATCPSLALQIRSTAAELRDAQVSECEEGTRWEPRRLQPWDGLVLTRPFAFLPRQLCDYFAFCDGDEGSLLTYEFNLPQIRAQDRCTKISFQKETCLKAIAAGLQNYNSFLMLVETSSVGSNDQMTWMRSSTQQLAEQVRHQLNAEFGVRDGSESERELEVSASDLVSKTEWNRQVNVYVILRDFTRFMEKASRALRFMSL
ncbi:interleukin-6-like isoform X2 [Narcine bancroftii]|uniref:interleukin-6-like isoform X2 n=1 Tax=Narcine bancroftii TaxID=1343680 RepID=UPI003831E77D